MINYYVPPAEAYRKIQFAYDVRTPVYIYGATGFGKTSLAQYFLKDKSYVRYSATALNGEKTVRELIDGDADGVSCVLIDDLQFLDDTQVQKEIAELMRAGKYWLVLVGRMQLPTWLYPLIAECQITVISERDLNLGEKETRLIVENNGLQLTQSEFELLMAETHGNAYALTIGMQMLNDGQRLDKGFAAYTRNIFLEYLDSHVIEQWSLPMQEFLMKLSVVEKFNLQLAETISGDDKSLAMIENAAAVGNFITKQGEYYCIRPELREILRKRAIKKLGSKKVKQCIYNAGLYYEMHDDITSALAMYEECGEKDNVRALLTRNGRRNPSAGHFYELRHYYLALTPEEVENSVILMCAMSMLYSVLLNEEQSEYWYDRLKAYAARSRGAEKREADVCLFYLEIALPHRGDVHVAELIRHAFPILRGNGAEFPEFSVTNNQPSLMNGGKDFCEWSKNDKLIADTIGRLIENMLGRNGHGVVSAAMGESYFEKGADNYETMTYLTRAQVEIESGGSLEMLFVPVGLQIRMNILDGNLFNARLQLDSFERRVKKEKEVRFFPNLNALRCRIAMYAAEMSEVEKWLDEAPDENMEFCTLERYRYLTKVRCYLALGKNAEAISLLERLIYFSEISKRTYINIECRLLMAVARKRVQTEWQEMLIKTLDKAAEYHFVRVVSELGAAIFPLLREIKKSYLEAKTSDKEWFMQTYREAEQTANKYPAYLNSNGVSKADFSATALEILRMQASAMSVKEIAEKLGISERTVKYHSAENYRKLEAKGKTDAVQKAVELRII